LKILITNIVTLNAGDAAILYAMIDVLRAAFGQNTKFVVYDKHGDVPSRYYPEIIFRKLLYLTRESSAPKSNVWRRLDRLRFRIGLWALKHSVPLLPRVVLRTTEYQDLLEYKTADLIVSSGGTYLVENYSMEARIFDYQLSLYLEKPLVFFTQSLGPFANPSNQKALRPIFEDSIAILVRDEQSRRNLSDLGIDANIHLAADAAFALSDLEALQVAKVRLQPMTKKLRVAISVREWRHFKGIEPEQGMKQYRDALRALTTHLVKKYDAAITYLSTCQGMPEYWTDDSRLAKTIVAELSEDVRASVSVDSDFHGPAALAKILKDYDLVIATRMHMAILALGAGVPVLPIAYEFKMKELFERLGHGRWVQDIETLSADGLINAADQFLQELPATRETLFTAVQNEHASAAASGTIVKEAFEEWRRAKHK